jgi:hypothetical protein
MKIFLITLCILLSVLSKAQRIPLLGKLQNDSIKLRWVPLNAAMYKKAFSEGFKLMRLDRSGNILSTKIVFPVPAEDSLWKILLKSEKNSLVAWQLIKSMQDPSGETAFLETIFGLALMQANFSRRTAKLMGLSFHEKYSAGTQYRISVQGFPEQEGVLDENTIQQGAFPRVDSLGGKNSGNINRIFWRHASIPGYRLERSVDGILFESVSENPIVPLFEHDPGEWVHFEDTLMKDKTLYYRVYGLDYFGDRSQISDTIIIKTCPSLKDAPGNVEFKTLDKKYLVVQCSQLDKHAAGSRVFRADKISGPYLSLTPLLLRHENIFIDTSVSHSAYYIWASYNDCGDSLLSWPAYYFLPDTIPPPAPVGLSAIPDRKGKVNLSWNSIKSNDLIGYRIFKTSASAEDYVEVTEEITRDTFHLLYFPLNSLTNRVYVKVCAVDSDYNVSLPSEILSIRLPDTIKPVSPIMVKAESGLEGVHLSWIKGGSGDVKQIFICRRMRDKADTLLKLLPGNSLSVCTDTSISQGTLANYYIIEVDSSGNFSFSNSLEVLHETGYRKPPPAPLLKKDPVNNSIHIIIETAGKELNSIQLYKGIDGGELSLWKTVGAGMIIDREISISVTYTYAYRLIFASGVKTLLSKSASIQF